MNFNQIQVGGPYDCPTVTTTYASSGYSFPETINYGWVCPKCGRVYSPSTIMCSYCDGNNNIMPATSNTPLKKEWWRDYCTITSDPSKLPKQELPATDNADTFRVHFDQLPYYTTITAWN